MSELQWSSDSLIQLIESYKEKPMLWNCAHPMYRVSTVKYEAWDELAREFDCDILDIRRKLFSLYASHRREKAKIRYGGKSTWFLYKHLSFLPGHVPMETEAPAPQEINSKSASEKESEESNNDSETDAFDDVIEEIIIKEEPLVIEHVDKRYKNKSRMTHQPNRAGLIRKVTKVIKSNREKNKAAANRISKKSKHQVNDKPIEKVNDTLIEAVKLLSNVDTKRRKDECDSFGEYIAESLRRHDDRTQSMIKQAINNILFEQEMKKYNTSTTSTLTLVVNGLDENPLKLSLDDDK